MHTDILDINDPKNVISDHYPEKYGDLLIWNIESHRPEVMVLAYNIAMQIRNNGIETVMLQEVLGEVNVRDEDGNISERVIHQELLEAINYYLSETDSPPLLENSRKIILPENFIFQKKADHKFGNVVFSVKPVVASSEQLDEGPKKQAIAQLKKAIKDAGGEEGQIQVAIVDNRILLNVHANSVREEEKVGFLKKIKQRINLHKVYDFIQKNKSKPPFQDFEIIMAGDFNAGEFQLPRDILGKKEAFNHHLNQEAGYQHAQPGSSFVPLTNNTQRSNAVDAVFHFNVNGAKPELTAQVDANLEEKLPTEIKALIAYPSKLPEKPKPTPKKEEATKSKFTTDEKTATAMTALESYFTIEKGFGFKKEQDSSIITIPGAGDIEVVKKVSSLEFSTKLPKQTEAHEQLLGALADAVRVAGVKKVKLEVNMVDGEGKTKVLDQMWLSAVKQGLAVEGYKPKNPEILKKVKKAEPELGKSPDSLSKSPK